MVERLAQARKALVGVVGILAELVNTGALHGHAEHIADVVIATAVALGVYAIPNDDKPPPTGS